MLRQLLTEAEFLKSHHMAIKAMLTIFRPMGPDYARGIRNTLLAIYELKKRFENKAETEIAPEDLTHFNHVLDKFNFEFTIVQLQLLTPKGNDTISLFYLSRFAHNVNLAIGLYKPAHIQFTHCLLDKPSLPPIFELQSLQERLQTLQIREEVSENVGEDSEQVYPIADEGGSYLPMYRQARSAAPSASFMQSVREWFAYAYKATEAVVGDIRNRML